ncbi:acetate kinase [uncultured Meiothermus sp.]|uniref:acetate kinase n=1 Tax=uncultured Meiothermus sp. TaxID=157471 RepID=UPI0026234404|nr:acetate kinase [uncultured Meiothermus sp.]
MSLTLVLNCGSSSIKFAVLNLEDKRTVLSGLAERLFEAQPRLKTNPPGLTEELELSGPGHARAVQGILQLLERQGLPGQVTQIGHRVVHGGERFKQATCIDDEVLAQIEACGPLAPLHNPANLLGIRAAMEAFPGLPQVAVFDTAFHQTMPPHAYRYAVPEDWYTRHGVRRYGFHGTSHAYVTQEAARMLEIPVQNTCFVSAHLGNGCSIAAVKGGKSLDTSMGLTPLEGLVMGTRSGDLDPGLHAFLAENLKLSLGEVNDVLNKKSGLLGLSGLSNDMRELERAAADGHEGAQLALEVFCYRLARYAAAMCVPLGRLDALIFTGGIGENSALVRAKTLGYLTWLGFVLDADLNRVMIRGSSGLITQPGSPLALVIHTNEELMIALEAQEVLS